MQPPTICNLRIRSCADAHVLFHAVRIGILPMVERRLDAEERVNVKPGSIYIWEERGSPLEVTGMGIERWTDGFRWGPSRLKHDFLFYQEREPETLYDQGHDVNEGRWVSMKRRRMQSHQGTGEGRTGINEWDRLVKQTYSVHLCDPGRPEEQPLRKWHMTAYFNRRNVNAFQTIDEHPTLRSLQVPEGLYKNARAAKYKSVQSRIYPPSPIKKPSFPRDVTYAYSRHNWERVQATIAERANLGDLSPISIPLSPFPRSLQNYSSTSSSSIGFPSHRATHHSEHSPSDSELSPTSSTPPQTPLSCTSTLSLVSPLSNECSISPKSWDRQILLSRVAVEPTKPAVWHPRTLFRHSDDVAQLSKLNIAAGLV